MENEINLNLNQGKGKKKSDKGSHISAFITAIGDDVKIYYTIGEDSKSYNYCITLKSGDVFVISSDVKSMKIAVKAVVENTKPKELVIREGTLIMLAERE
jgi:tmRNA-binding protein